MKMSAKHTFSASCLLILFINISPSLTKQPSVIIVGAGASGIAAATKLLENSITNVTILEAENRIGGRIWSVNFGKGFVDIGAQYCHGEEGNVVYQLTKDLDVLEHTHSFTPDKQKFYSSDGTIVLSDVADDIKKAIENYSDDLNTSDGVTMRDAFLEKYNSSVLKKYKNEKNKLKLATDGIDLIHGSILFLEGAFNWKDIAPAAHFEYCEGDQEMTWKIKGSKIILDILMKSFPNPDEKLPIDDKILLNKQVNKIIWKDDEIIVKSSDNTAWSAQHVIFTPSVGVLRKQDTMFEPDLPSEKKLAIQAIGLDGIMKIILRFPKQWWKDDDFNFLFLWRNDALNKIKEEFPNGPHKNGISWISNVRILTTISTSSDVLIAWVSGEMVPEIETAPEDVIIQGCMYLFRKFLSKDYNITEPDKILRSKFSSNPNFLGTYSYEKAKYFKKEISYNAKLAEPLVNRQGKPTVLFAGEATNSIHYSTVHGAIESGRREAQRIINLYNK